MLFTKNFTELNKEEVTIAGGKGASLGEMTNAKIPVPYGFVVLSTAFDRFLNETSLKAEIEAELDKVNVHEVHTVEFASEVIQGLIKGQKMPVDLQEEITSNFKKLDCEFVAVRSSATAEDSASAAWAGQLDSFLNTTKDSLLENVLNCWASLFTPRAIAYRFEKELHKEHISVAVVVQKMINSDVSGIAFSVHPVTEDYNQLIIEAGFGLGEAIVSGSITPDSFVIDKRDYSVIEEDISNQERKLIRKDNGGNEWVEFDGSSKTLSPENLIELAKLVVKIEDHYGFPVDVEWCIENDEICIVQSRPITTLKKINIQKEKSEDECTYEIIAHDFNTPLFRNELWTESFIYQSKEFSIPPLDIGLLVKENQAEYFCKMTTWVDAHNKIKERVKEDNNYVEKIINKTLMLGESFNNWSQKEIFYKNLSNVPDEELFSLIKLFREKMIELYSYGTILPVIDFLEFSFVEGNLKKILSKTDNFQEYFELFSYPLHDSYAQEQEKSLLKLMIKHHKACEIIRNEEMDYVCNNFPEFKESLDEHTQKYSWVYYVYEGPAFTKKEFFSFIQEEIRKGTEPKKKLQAIEEKRKSIDRKREEKIKEIANNEFEELILKLAPKMVWAKPRRKDHQSKSYFHIEKLFKEIGKRHDLSLKEARTLTFKQTEELLLHNNINKSEVQELFSCHLCLPSKGKVKILKGDEAISTSNSIIKKIEATNNNKETIIKGTIACKGKSKGKVKIIDQPKDMIKMESGDILVSKATTPSIMPAIKKASAIITDEGGLTCHAAIVSRELNIPCIVGTKNITSMLKDNDLVEVDANTGVIKKC